MPGCYNDTITCNILGKDGTFLMEHFLPLKMYVRGCPFTIVETSLGMSFHPTNDVEKEVEKENKKDGSNDDLTSLENKSTYKNTKNNKNGKNHEKEKSRGRPLLLVGHSTINSDPPVREFLVRNEGSKVGFVSWVCTASYPGLDTDR